MKIRSKIAVVVVIVTVIGISSLSRNFAIVNAYSERGPANQALQQAGEITSSTPNFQTDSPKIDASPTLASNYFVSASSMPVLQPAATFAPLMRQPLKNSIATLQSAVAQGDQTAQCLLAQALTHCAAFKMQGKQERLNLLQRQLELLESSPHEANLIAEDLATFDTSRKFCAGLERSTLASAEQMLVQAARNGSRSAMYYFVEGSFLGFGQPDFLAKPEFPIWQDQALNAANDMARRGWVEVVPLLALAYRSKKTHFSALIADDPFQARVYDVLASLLFDEFPATQPLPAQRELDAQSQARAIWTGSFGRHSNQMGNYFGPPSIASMNLENTCI
jgi:hypothetical protein